MLKNKKTLIFILVTILIIFAFQTVVRAEKFNPSEWDPSTTQDPLDPTAKKIAGIVTGAISSIGSVVAILALIIIGIRFMLGSVEEKAQYKESLKPYFIGAFLLFAILQIVNVLYKLGIGLVT